MTTPPPHATGLGWDAVSPAFGRLPAIYVNVPAPTGGTMSDIPADLRYSQDLAGTPEVVNTDPYGQGWMFEVEIDPSTLDQQLARLMDAGAYRRLAGA
jgi:glycine cleavage system H lipoate-binding protein